MIQAESDLQKRDEYMQRLMDLPYQVSVTPPFSIPILFIHGINSTEKKIDP
jgi:hypothetical protein